MKANKGKKYIFSIYDDVAFTSARILNLIYKIESDNLQRFLRFEDLNYIDFFASHPFLIFERGQKEYRDLRYYGFTDNSLEYINSKHIFSNQREKLKHVFALLISKDLIKLEFEKKMIIYRLTELGVEVVSKFTNDYYKGYIKSVEYILNIIKKANQKEIREYQEIWLNNSTKFAIT